MFWSNSNGSNSMKTLLILQTPFMYIIVTKTGNNLWEGWGGYILYSVKLNIVRYRKLKCVCIKTCFSISKVLMHINNELLIGQWAILLCHLNLLLYGNSRECPLLYSPPSIQRTKSMDSWSKYFLEWNPSQNEHKIEYSLVACDISWATWVNYSCMSPLGLSIIQYVLFNFQFQAGKLTMYTCLCQ